MIEAIVPGRVAAAESFGAPAGTGLFPAEQALIATAPSARRAEFAAGRARARAVLAILGLADGPVLAGPDGAPRWPPGVVGSITHCPGYQAAIAALAEDWAALGVDAEVDQPLPPSVLGQVASPEERDQVAGLTASRPDVRWDRLLFCAKEAVFKAWYPLTAQPPGWLDTYIRIDPDGAEFVAMQPAVRAGRQRPDARLATATGRWRADRGLLLAIVAVG